MTGNSPDKNGGGGGGGGEERERERLEDRHCVLTGCMVPPATMTALASLTMEEKWREGFKSRNFKLDPEIRQLIVSLCD